jgi:hypothetical protein
VTRKAVATPAIHVRIGRIVVDSAALRGASRESLHADIGAALSQRLSGQIASGPPTLAQQIAGSVAPQIQAPIRARGGRNGAS